MPDLFGWCCLVRQGRAEKTHVLNYCACVKTTFACVEIVSHHVFHTFSCSCSCFGTTLKLLAAVKVSQRPPFITCCSAFLLLLPPPPPPPAALLPPPLLSPPLLLPSVLFLNSAAAVVLVVVLLLVVVALEVAELVFVCTGVDVNGTCPVVDMTMLRWVMFLAKLATSVSGGGGGGGAGIVSWSGLTLITDLQYCIVTFLLLLIRRWIPAVLGCPGCLCYHRHSFPQRPP